MSDTSRLNVIGRPLPRVDALEKVDGKARYVDDYRIEGLVHCAMTLSPHPHAEVLSIRTDEALAVPGVLGVFTAPDVPVNQIGCVFQDQPLLAAERVRFVGDRVALVVAKTRDIARKAAALVKVDYRPLPSVHDAEEALKDVAPKLHAQGNLLAHQKIRFGDAAACLAACDVVVEHEFEVNYQEHAYLEPQGALAVPEAGGGVTIAGSMQCPFYVQSGVARALGLDRNRVRVEQAVTGGGFGGKEEYPSEVAALAALAALATGRPAKLVFSRAEDFQISTKRHRMRMRYKVGADREGKLQAIYVTQFVDSGGYAGLSTVVAERANTTAAGPYFFPNAHVDTFIVYTNNLLGGAFRGFGNPQVTFAIEGMMERLAARLGMDPVELRRKNLLSEGMPLICGQALPPSAPSRDVLDTLAQRSDFDRLRAEALEFNRTHRFRRKGVGLALSMYGCCLHAGGQHLEGSGALVQVRADGSVEVNIGGTELGQGAFTVVAQIAAETLGADYARVRVLPTDTRMVADSGPTVASRTTIMSGNAVRAASLQIRSRLVELAASMLGCPSREVEVGNGAYRQVPVDPPALRPEVSASAPSPVTIDHPSSTISQANVRFPDLCMEAFRRKLHLAASGWYAPPPKPWDKDTGQGIAYSVYCFTGNVAVVEVDLIGGLVKVEKVFAVHDVGQVLNPVTLEGQVHGGIVQGMGWALSENLVLDKGRCLNPGFTDYLIPSSLDMPQMDATFVEEPYPDGPFGAKGIGEPSLISVPTAVALAAGSACGQLPDRLPVTPETVLRWTAKDGNGQ